MCMSVYYRGKRYSSVGELAALVGRENLVTYEDGRADGDDLCLCGVRKADTAWNFNCNAYTDGVEVEFVPFGEKPKWGDRLMERRLSGEKPLPADAQANNDGY